MFGNGQIAVKVYGVGICNRGHKASWFLITLNGANGQIWLYCRLSLSWARKVQGERVIKMRRFLCLLVTTGALLSAAWGQKMPQTQLKARPPALPPPGGTDQQITMDVQVTERSGVPVRGLQQQDFTLLDDREPRTILSFHEVNSKEDLPVQIILVVDAVDATFQHVAYEREGIRKFLLRNGGRLSVPVSLVVFATAGTKIQSAPSQDGNALAALYDQYETGLRSITRSQGFYGATERFARSLNLLTSLAQFEEKQPGRKLMIWLSPGWPMLADPSLDFSKDDEDRFFNSIVGLSSELRHARITLYDVDPFGIDDAGAIREYYYQEFLKGVKSPSQALPPNLSLQVLAVQSGGRVLNQSNDLAGEIASCTADGESFYVLSFNAARADQVNEYHSLNIKIDKPDTTVRTHTGYYAQP